MMQIFISRSIETLQHVKKLQKTHLLGEITIFYVNLSALSKIQFRLCGKIPGNFLIINEFLINCPHGLDDAGGLFVFLKFLFFLHRHRNKVSACEKCRLFKNRMLHTFIQWNIYCVVKINSIVHSRIEEKSVT